MQILRVLFDLMSSAKKTSASSKAIRKYNANYIATYYNCY